MTESPHSPVAQAGADRVGRKHARWRIIAVCAVVAIVMFGFFFWPRSVGERVNRILGNPAEDDIQAYEKARPITKAKTMELIGLVDADARRLRYRDRLIALTDGRVHGFTPDYVAVRMLTAGKNLVLEPLLEIARDKEAGLGVRYWVLRRLNNFNDTRVLDAWMDFLESAPMYSGAVAGFLPLPYDWGLIDTRALVSEGKANTPSEEGKLWFVALQAKLAELKAEMQGKSFEEFVLELLDKRLSDPGLTPDDPGILRWLNRYYGYDFNEWLSENAPDAAVFRNKALQKGYQAYGPLFSDFYFAAAPGAPNFDEEGLTKVLPREEDRIGCHELLQVCYYKDIAPEDTDKWRERLTAWYAEARPHLKYDPALGRFVERRPGGTVGSTESQVNGTLKEAVVPANGSSAITAEGTTERAAPAVSPVDKPPADSSTPTGGTSSRVTPANGQTTVGAKEPAHTISNELLKDRSPMDLRYEINKLGKARDGSAVDDLTVLLSHESAEVREAAAIALGHIADPKGGDALAKVMDADSDEWVRNMAAWALAAISDSRAKPIPLDLLDDGGFSPQDEPKAWNRDVISGPFDVSKSTEVGKRVNVTLPVHAPASGLSANKEAGEALLRSLRKLVKGRYLPESIAVHMVKVRNVPVAKPGAGGDSDRSFFGQETVTFGDEPIAADAAFVRYVAGGYVFQIRDTEYDTIIWIGRDNKEPKRRKDGIRYMVETAATVFKNHVARRVRTPEELMDIAEIKEGAPQNEVRWPQALMPHYESKDDREMRRLRRESGLCPSDFYASTDGYWVEFRIMKDGELGGTKLGEERMKRIDSIMGGEAQP